MEYLVAEFKINCQSDILQIARDLLADVAGEAGFESFEDTEKGMKGYVQKKNFDQQVLDTSIASLQLDNCSITYIIANVENKDWNETWEKAGFEPIEMNNPTTVTSGDTNQDAIQRLTIIDASKSEENQSSQPSTTQYIKIEARQAFGTGTHQTTQMIVENLLSLNLKGKRIMDCGCGTGILSIAALKLGANEAVGYDIDEWSVENTKHNAKLNNVSNNIHVIHGDASIIRTIKGNFDIVLANINRNILLQDMEAMTSKMKRDSLLIISGFYKKDTTMLQQKAAELGLELIGGQSKEEWSCLKFKA